MSEISIVVPVYNVEEYLRRCVDSILAQTYSDFELILVDDGSPDNSGKICDEYAKLDERITVIHRPNGGLSVARNTGIDWCDENSNSKWITFIDSDDWIHPKYLESLLEAAEKTNLNISVCMPYTTNSYEIFNFTPTKEITTQSPEDYFCNFIIEATVAWGKLYLRKLFDGIRYPQGRLHEDMYITHVILFRECKIAILNDRLYYYFENVNGITHQKSSKRTKDMRDGCHVRLEYFKSNGFMKAYTYEVNSVGYLVDELAMIKERGILSEKARLRKTQRKLRIALHREQTDFKNKIWVYELAYPKMMKLYWYMIALKNKMVHMFKQITKA